MEPYTVSGPDPVNSGHVLFVVRGKMYSIFSGYEQQTADEIAYNLDG